MAKKQLRRGSNGYGATQAQMMQTLQMAQMLTQMKETPLTLGTTNIYGRNSIFGPCSPGDVFGLQVQTHGLPNWLGWRPNSFYRRRVDFITYIGPSGTAAGTAVTGAVAPCDDPTGVEFGSAGYDLVHSSWYAHQGSALGPHDVGMNRCETSPRYRINGVQIMDDVEWQVNLIMHVLNQSINRDIIHGSHDNANEMNGLESIVKTGYTDDDGHLTPMIDSILVDWLSDDLDGLANSLGNFFNYLDELVTDIEYRASPIGTIADNDMALFCPRFQATALLDAIACYTTCGVTTANDITDQALRAQQRAARRELNGGPLFDGRVAVGYLHLKSGRKLPIIVEDNIDISRNGTSYCSDMYILTRRIGSIDVLHGEYLDLRVWETAILKKLKDFSGRTEQAGRFAFKHKEDNFCVVPLVGTSTELYLAAPWAQVRISNVCTSRVRQPLTGDPFQLEYLPGGSGLYPAYPYG